jgi:hypothetical protein
MIQDARIGTFVKSLPIPHVPADTVLFPAGPVTIGLEYRVFDPVAEAAKLTPEEVAAAGPDSLFGQTTVDRGVCLHVFGTDSKAEYLRFDCFLDEPHYHYIVPDDGNMLIHFDETANGPMLEWALEAIERRLGAMLTLVGAGALAASVDEALVLQALAELRPLARAQMAAA